MTKTCGSLLIQLVVLALVVSTSTAFLGVSRASSAVLSPVAATRRAAATPKSTTSSSSSSSLMSQSSVTDASDSTTLGSSNDNDDAVVIDKDFRLAGIFLSIGLLFDTIPWIQLTLGPIVTLLGVLFLVQTVRLNFVCDSSAFELQTQSGGDTGENVIVGGANRWRYDTFVNYATFPKGWIDQPQGPILVYFKETQTPSDKWNEGPGKSANSKESLAKGGKPGQVHFFPALCNTRQLRAEWERRGCSKID
jgi:hypothetical protein